MRFATRTFLLSFLPFALLLGGSFWFIHRMVETEVRKNVSVSLRDAAVSMKKLRDKSQLQDNRFLRVVGENPALKAGINLLLADRKSGSARLTVEDQLREISDELQFDYMMVSGPDNKPLAGVLRVGNAMMTMDIGHVGPTGSSGFWSFNDKLFQIASVPVNQGDENIGNLTVGEDFRLDDFVTPVVLTQNGKVVVASQMPRELSRAEMEASMQSCKSGQECDVRLGGETYVTTSIDYAQGYTLRTMQNMDSKTRPVQKSLQTVFIVAGLAAILMALLMTVISSRSIVRPLAGVVETLKQSERTGLLPEFKQKQTTVLEIRELTENFNRAGASIREARERLNAAYVEFVGSLAGALDARDTYTAGHSRRVSEYSCLIAGLVGASGDELEEIRIGALLHDFGKVGIPDAVLQKPGRLSAEEFTILKQHPVIGRRILEGVAGFQAYLPVVELHHENWDGTGYPSGLRGEQVPLFARIVHVADAYDAMTSDRPYRRGLSHEQAVAELLKFAGSQFDPTIVSVFIKAHVPAILRRPSEDDQKLGLHIV